MAAAARAGRRLFGLPSVVAVAQWLPFADASFDAAWCLGVLCTTSDKAGLLTELRRVLVPGARLGLLVFVADGPLPPPLPEGNEFPSEAETRRLLADAGFALEATGEADLGDSPEECTRRGTPSTPRSSAGTARTRPTGWRRSSRGGSGGCSPTARCGPGSASPWPPDPRDPPSRRPWRTASTAVSRVTCG
jgi:SAM-dependent methyltransferase